MENAALSMIERMAIAICNAGPDKTPWEAARAEVKDMHREEARAAIAALRDPVDEARARLRYAGDTFHDQGNQLQAEACWKVSDALAALTLQS